MGRAPCCDKANVKKGPWSPEEDATLKSYIEQHGTGGNWIALPQKIGLKRCGKSCRLRWLNYLRPNIKHGGFSEEEDNIICSLYISIGSRWSIIAAQLPGRTDNDIKNYWNTRLKKKLLGKQRKEQAARRSNHSSNQKQEMLRKGRDNNNFFLPSSTISSDHHNNFHDTINQNPYWPDLPVLPPIPYSNEEPRFNDHASIRKLLIKLGGKFSDIDDNHNHQTANGEGGGMINNHVHHDHHYPLGSNSMVQLLYDQQQISMQSAPAPSNTEVLNSSTTFTILPDEKQYNVNGADFSTANVKAGHSGVHHADLDQMMDHSNPQKLDGLEFLCGDILINNKMGSFDWGEMSSMLLPSYDLQSLQQGTTSLQDFAIDQVRYTGQ